MAPMSLRFGRGQGEGEESEYTARSVEGGGNDAGGDRSRGYRSPTEDQANSNDTTRQPEGSTVPTPPTTVVTFLGIPIDTSSRSATPTLNALTGPPHSSTTDISGIDRNANSREHYNYRTLPSAPSHLSAAAPTGNLLDSDPPPLPSVEHTHITTPPIDNGTLLGDSRGGAHNTSIINRTVPTQPSRIHLSTLLTQLRIKIDTFPTRGTHADRVSKASQIARDVTDLRTQFQELGDTEHLNQVKCLENRLIDLQLSFNANTKAGVDNQPSTLSHLHDSPHDANQYRGITPVTTGSGHTITSAFETDHSIDRPPQLVAASTHIDPYINTGAIPRRPKPTATTGALSNPSSANTSYTQLNHPDYTDASIESRALSFPPTTSGSFGTSQIFHDSGIQPPRTNPRASHTHVDRLTGNTGPSSLNGRFRAIESCTKSTELAVTKLQNQYRFIKNSLSSFALNDDVVREMHKVVSLEDNITSMQQAVTVMNSTIQQMSSSLRRAHELIDLLDNRCTTYESSMQQLSNKFALNTVIHHKEPYPQAPEYIIHPLHTTGFDHAQSTSHSDNPPEDTPPIVTTNDFSPPRLTRQNAMPYGQPAHLMPASTLGHRPQIPPLFAAAQPAPTTAVNALPRAPNPSILQPAAQTHANVAAPLNQHLHNIPPLAPVQPQAQDTPFEASIKELSNDLIAILDPADLNTVSRHEISQIYSSILTHVESERRSLDRKIQLYMDRPHPRADIMDIAWDALRQSQRWVRELCRKHQLSNAASSKQRPLEALPKFKRFGSLTIWELLDKFERLTTHMDEDEKLDALFSKLDDPIQDEVRLINTNYGMLRDYLVQSYGNMTYIVESTIGSILDNPAPAGNNPRELSEYLFKLHASLSKLGDLIKVETIPGGKVKQAIYNHLFISRVVKHLPYHIGTLFYQALQREQIIIEEAEGERVFKLMAGIIFDSYKISIQYSNTASDSVLKQRGKPKGITKPGVHHQDATTGTNKDLRKPAKRPQPSGLQFPCPLDPASSHKHELPLCIQFMSMSPRDRFQAIRKTRCISCLGPAAKCREQCINHDTVHEMGMFCKECLAWSQANDKSCRHMLLCGLTQHSKLPLQEFLGKLENFFAGIQGIGNMEVNMTCHADNADQTDILAANISTQQHYHNTTTLGGPLFHTNTGQVVYSDQHSIMPAPIHCSAYITQVLNIGGTDVLVMYDSGANVNLIDSQLALQLQLECINNDTTPINTVGGTSQMIGTFSLTLGPDPDNAYHSVTLHGFSSITRRFAKFPLDSITQELLVSDCDISPNEPIPAYTGGDQARILIGIQSVALMPRLIGSLPSGTAVYRSPLTDKWGSTIIFAGPNPVFSARSDSMYASALHASGNSSPLEPGPAFSSIHTHSFAHTTQKTGIMQNFAVDYDPLCISQDYLQECQLNCVTPQSLDISSPITLDVLKAKRISAAHKKIFLDLCDLSKEHIIRCQDCEACPCRYQPPIKKAKSIQEQHEQDKIVESVTIGEGITTVTLPFITNPIDFLTKKYKGAQSNIFTARRVLDVQRRKPAHIRAELVSVFNELVNKGFATKLSMLPEEQQQLVLNAPFRHFFVWKGVEKKDSLSTPVRLVVDATQSGLNLTLCKGNSNLNKLREILLSARFNKHLLSIDLTKMYNSLRLQPDAFPYSLLLFSETLSLSEEPEVYVLTTAWYGTVSAGAQAAVAMSQLAQQHKSQFPSAHIPLTRKRYVDDILSGADSIENLKTQATHIKSTLAAGGFNVKYIIFSGEKPEEGASKDKHSVNTLGYKWCPLPDTLGFNYHSINDTLSDAPNSFTNIDITRRIIISMIGRFFDPMGLLEPFRLQLKLDTILISQYNWDTPLPRDLSKLWRDRFHQIQLISDVHFPRSVVHHDCVDPTKLRIIVFADGGQNAAGCVAYASYLLRDGSYSSQIIAAKSKLTSLTIPRNELIAIKIATELAADIKAALPEHTTEFLFLTDSMIALSWCLNTSKALRLFVLNRVQEIRHAILGITQCQQDSLPLFHIDSESNIADLLTKVHPITPLDLGPSSLWSTGPSWLQNHFDNMPLTSFRDFQLSAEQRELHNKECFPTFLLSSDIFTLDDQEFDPLDDSLAAHSNSNHLIDPIFFGWKKTISILSTILQGVANWSHKALHRANPAKHCQLCIHGPVECIVDPLATNKIYNEHAKNFLFKEESTRLSALLPPKELAKFPLMDGILRLRTRLSVDLGVETRDIQDTPFLDSHIYPPLLPVVAAKSELFVSFVLFVHNVLRPHCGIESTLCIVLTQMFPIGRPRRVIGKIIQDCTKCKIIAKKTIELKLADHPSVRLTMSPPFHTVMVDVVFGFKFLPFLNARRSQKGYALILVCLFSGATNILALEALSTQAVVNCIERHAYRYGAPAICFIDNGSQLVALQSATFSLRSCQFMVKDNLGMDIRIAAPKNHRGQGRVEAKVKCLRQMLERLPLHQPIANSPIQWETIFAFISNTINDLPFCTTGSSKDLTASILTPNRLILGRNGFRSLEGPMDISSALLPSNILERNREISDAWRTIFQSSLHQLIPRPQKWTEDDSLSEGDIVLFTHNDNPISPTWKVGRITKIVSRGRVLIEYVNSTNPTSTKVTILTLERCPRNVSRLFSENELSITTRSYFQEQILNSQ